VDQFGAVTPPREGFWRQRGTPPPFSFVSTLRIFRLRLGWRLWEDEGTRGRVAGARAVPKGRIPGDLDRYALVPLPCS
jgi:hypothetical protein